MADGDHFTVIDGTTRFLFEFEDMAGGQRARLVGSILINFSPADTQDQLADRIINRLKAVAGLNLLPEKTTGAVRVHLGAVAYDTNPFTFVTLNTSRTHLSQTGPSDRLVDGQRIFLTNGTTVAALELDLNGSVRPAAPRSTSTAGSTPHQIASEIIFEINRAAGLDAAGPGATARFTSGAPSGTTWIRPASRPLPSWARAARSRRTGVLRHRSRSDEAVRVRQRRRR